MLNSTDINKIPFDQLERAARSLYVSFYESFLRSDFVRSKDKPIVSIFEYDDMEAYIDNILENNENSLKLSYELDSNNYEIEFSKNSLEKMRDFFSILVREYNNIGDNPSEKKIVKMYEKSFSRIDDVFKRVLQAKESLPLREELRKIADKRMTKKGKEGNIGPLSLLVAFFIHVGQQIVKTKDKLVKLIVDLIKNQEKTVDRTSPSYKSGEKIDDDDIRLLEVVKQDIGEVKKVDNVVPAAPPIDGLENFNQRSDSTVEDKDKKPALQTAGARHQQGSSDHQLIQELQAAFKKRASTSNSIMDKFSKFDKKQYSSKSNTDFRDKLKLLNSAQSSQVERETDSKKKLSVKDRVDDAGLSGVSSRMASPSIDEVERRKHQK